MTAVLETPMSGAAQAPAAALYRWRWPALVVVLAGSAMELLDATVTSIAGPTIRADLGGGTALLQWLGVAYTLAMVGGLLTGGRLGDIVGRRRMFVIGATGFVISSMVCAAAVTPGMLVAGRVAQGLFGAAMIPQGLGLMKEMFPPKEQAMAFGAMGPLMGLSAIGGPILAGWLVSADLFGTGWRMIFLINLPIGAATVLGALWFLPRTRPEGGLRLDLRGAVLASLGSLLLVFPLVQGHEYGWPAWMIVMMAGSVVVFLAFAWSARRTAARGGDPLIVPSLLRNRAFLGGLATGTAFFSAFAGFGLVFNLYLQIGLGYPPVTAGFAGLPLTIGMIAGMGLVQSLVRHGRRVLHAGVAVMAAGTVVLAVQIHPGIGPWAMAPALATIGLGAGLGMVPFFSIVLAGVSPHETGSASGTLTALQQVGGAVGMALLGSVFFGTGAPPSAAAGITFLVVVAMLALTFLVGFLLPRHAESGWAPAE